MADNLSTTSTQDLSLNDEELMRYSRQILLEGWDITAQEHLKNSTVVIVGAGGLGCPASETLARAGVGRIHIIDHDVIEPSNLQRQTLFTDQHIGEYKAETACKTLQKINPFIQVTYQNTKLLPNTINSLLEELSVSQLPLKQSASSKSINLMSRLILLDCTDNFAVRILLNKFCVKQQLPLLSASAIAMSGQLALYESYKNTGCYHCVFGAALVNANGEITAKEQACATSGVLASTTTVVGNLQANLALQYLGLGNNPISGQLITWDGRHMSLSKIKYKQNKQCPICAECE